MLEARDIGVVFDETTILDGVELTVSPGEVVAIVGPNGAGKSTLARVAAGLLRPTTGEVRWDGEDIRKISRRRLARLRAFVPQRPRVPEGVLVREAVAMGRAPHIGPLRSAGAADHAAVDDAMRRAGVFELRDRRLTTLSGGELQRTQIAIGLAQGAPTLIADEPTAALDLGASAEIARILRGLADDGLATVVVIHDLGLAAALADRVLILDRGRQVAMGDPREELTGERLARIWNVDARLEHAGPGHTGLHVRWTDERGAA